MKILEKTIFRGKNKEIKALKELVAKIRQEYDDLLATNKYRGTQISNLKQQLDETNKLASESISKVMMENTMLKDKLAKTEKLRRKNAGAIGGLTVQNNKLIAENTELAFKYTELKKEYEEFKKNKFVVKELKAEKVPRKRQVMNVKSGAKTSRIIAKVKPIEDETK